MAIGRSPTPEVPPSVPVTCWNGTAGGVLGGHWSGRLSQRSSHRSPPAPDVPESSDLVRPVTLASGPHRPAFRSCQHPI
ncbi:hypothetical protein [Nonomuraea rubra]|uniref:hypothetical protein n=1 Tax=Nonomuraea rubra TaxID=46180 RepID=UPI0036094070